MMAATHIDLPQPIITYQKVNYYRLYREAAAVRDNLTAQQHLEARIVFYTRGWAVQYYKSGPYYPELENA
jgi:hypothetical protein